MKKPSLCIIAKVLWNTAIRENHLNLTPLRVLSPDFEKIYVVVQSIERRTRVSHDGRVCVVHLPCRKNRLLDYLLFTVSSIRVGLKLNAKKKVDIFDASEAIAGGLAGTILKALTGKKLMVHIQGELLNLPASTFLAGIKASAVRQIIRMVACCSDRTRCVSRSILLNAREAGIPEKKLVFIPSRCDTKIFDPVIKRAGAELKERLGLKNRKIVLFTGTFSVHKGLTYLLQAFSKVVTSIPQACLVLAGSGELESELRRLAGQLGITEHVVFCGRISYGEVPEYLSIADAFAFPSIDEGLPRSIMEAMAMKVPVVATRVGGIPELISQNETGLLVESRDVESLAKSIIRLLRADDLRGMTENARKWIVEHYDYYKGLRKYRDQLYAIAGMPHIAEFPAGK